MGQDWRAELSELKPVELLQRLTAIVAELRRQKIVRTQNNPVADYTEWLVATRLGYRLEGNSRSGSDAIGADGTRYQIKGRRVSASQASVQLSAIRNLQSRNFDFLIAVVFEEDFTIRHAVRIPHQVVCENATFQQYTNSHRFHVRPALLSDPRVVDIRGELGAA